MATSEVTGVGDEAISRQVRAAAEAVLLAEAPELSTLVVTGGDRVTWLNGLVTCDLGKSKPGDVVYGLAVAKNGRILADIFVAVAPEEVVVVVPRSAAADLRASLERYLIMEDAEIAEGDDAYRVLFADGPKARAVLDAARTAGALGGEIDLGGAGGALVLVPTARAAEVSSALEASIAANAGVRADERGFDLVRLERGRPRFGRDFAATTYPQEASLEKRAVSFSKGCYLGQEVVCMLEMRGHVKRKLVPLTLDAREAPARGAKVLDDAGTEVGEVTSAAFSPSLGQVVALGMVKRAHAEPGSALHVGGDVARVRAP